MFKSKIIRKYETSKNFPTQVNDHFLPMMLKYLHYNGKRQINYHPKLCSIIGKVALKIFY